MWSLVLRGRRLWVAALQSHGVEGNRYRPLSCISPPPATFLPHGHHHRPHSLYLAATGPPCSPPRCAGTGDAREPFHIFVDGWEAGLLWKEALWRSTPLTRPHRVGIPPAELPPPDAGVLLNRDVTLRGPDGNHAVLNAGCSIFSVASASPGPSKRRNAACFRPGLLEGNRRHRWACGGRAPWPCSGGTERSIAHPAAATRWEGQRAQGGGPSPSDLLHCFRSVHPSSSLAARGSPWRW